MAALSAAGLLVALVGTQPATASDRPSVLLVCNGTAPEGCPNGGDFTTIQAAVDAAKPGDWILVWPGVYHEKGKEAGVFITTPDIHLRGLDRNRVIIDGSNGTAGNPCPSDPKLQDLSARSGVEVFETNGTYIENFTVCNYLSDNNGKGGNEIWWNGGDGTGKQDIGSFWGGWLTATSTYYKDANSGQGQYGIFSSNAYGPGYIHDSYASNMGDSAFYVGACPDCNVTVDRIHAENSALGYSGTNAGGHLIIENSEWDMNKTGIVPNTLNNDDAPSPQNGACPNNPAASCTFIRNNYVHDNNNANVPLFGIAGEAPVGAGIEISGGSNDTVIDNRVENQGSWGILIHDFPDTETPPGIADCRGGIALPGNPGNVCYYNAVGNAVAFNKLADNGFFGNPTNGDLALQSTADPRNCFYGNVDLHGRLTSWPLRIESQLADGPPCNEPGVGDTGPLTEQLTCAAGITPCDVPLSIYPRPTAVTLMPIPHEPGMGDPCAGVPDNAYCPYAGTGTDTAANGHGGGGSSSYAEAARNARFFFAI